MTVKSNTKYFSEFDNAISQLPPIIETLEILEEILEIKKMKESTLVTLCIDRLLDVKNESERVLHEEKKA